MKKKLYDGTVVAIALAIACLMTACTSGTVTPDPPMQPAATTGVDAMQAEEASEACTAFESSETLTPEQLAAQEKERQDEIEREYAIYAPFGLTYDRTKDLFFFEGEVVRYFKDVISLSETNGFFYENGVMDLYGKRDTAGELIGLEKATQAEFDARTADHEKRKQEFDGIVSETSIASTYEVGDPNARDNSLDPYKPYGVSYDAGTKTWSFDGKPIHLFYDASYFTIVNESVTNGVNVQVVRNAKGEIEKLTEMTEADVRKIMD